jgi:hypothetical protein
MAEDRIPDLVARVRGHLVTMSYQAEERLDISMLVDAFADVRSAVINSPETADFMAGVPIEAAHQRDRWPSEHDAGKAPEDWLFLVGYLAGKACAAVRAGDITKARHHTISSAAALANWHASLTGASTAMRPGIAPPNGEV